MYRFSTCVVVCAFVMSFVLAGVARADDTMGDNPAYLSWAKFKPRLRIPRLATMRLTRK